MELYIAENYRIASDPMNKMLQERKFSKPTEKNPEPVERWETIGYYGTTAQASLAYKNICDTESEKQEIQGFVDDILASEKRIIEAIEQWKNAASVQTVQENNPL